MKISAEQLELLKIIRNAERDAIATGRRFYRYYEKTQAPFAERMFKTSTHDATTIGVILEESETGFEAACLLAYAEPDIGRQHLLRVECLHRVEVVLHQFRNGEVEFRGHLYSAVQQMPVVSGEESGYDVIRSQRYLSLADVSAVVVFLRGGVIVFPCGGDRYPSSGAFPCPGRRIPRRQPCIVSDDDFLLGFLGLAVV